MRVYISTIAVIGLLACTAKSFDTALIDDVNPCGDGEVVNPQGECDEVGSDADLDQDIDLDGDDTGESDADADADADDTGSGADDTGAE